MVAVFLWGIGEEAHPDRDGAVIAPSRPVWSRVADFMWDVDEEANKIGITTLPKMHSR